MIKRILSYWDRALFGGLCWYAVLNQMQAVAIAFALLAGRNNEFTEQN